MSLMSLTFGYDPKLLPWMANAKAGAKEAQKEANLAQKEIAKLVRAKMAVPKDLIEKAKSAQGVADVLKKTAKAQVEVKKDLNEVKHQVHFFETILKAKSVQNIVSGEGSFVDVLQLAHGKTGRKIMEGIGRNLESLGVKGAVAAAANIIPLASIGMLIGDLLVERASKSIEQDMKNADGLLKSFDPKHAFLSSSIRNKIYKDLFDNRTFSDRAGDYISDHLGDGLLVKALISRSNVDELTGKYTAERKNLILQATEEVKRSQTAALMYTGKTAEQLIQEGAAAQGKRTDELSARDKDEIIQKEIQKAEDPENPKNKRIIDQLVKNEVKIRLPKHSGITSVLDQMKNDQERLFGVKSEYDELIKDPKLREEMTAKWLAGLHNNIAVRTAQEEARQKEQDYITVEQVLMKRELEINTDVMIKHAGDKFFQNYDLSKLDVNQFGQTMEQQSKAYADKEKAIDPNGDEGPSGFSGMTGERGVDNSGKADFNVVVNQENANLENQYALRPITNRDYSQHEQVGDVGDKYDVKPYSGKDFSSQSSDNVGDVGDKFSINEEEDRRLLAKYSRNEMRPAPPVHAGF